MLQIDHIAVAGPNLQAAQAHVEESLGVDMQPGGSHAVFATHNMLLGLADGLYLEAIAADPAAPRPDRARWFDLDRFTGPARLTNWICRTNNLDAALSQIPLPLGAPVDLRRGDLSWRMAVPQDGRLPFDNCAPALIEWSTDRHPAARLAPSGLRLDRLTVRHPQADALQDALSGFLTDERIAFEPGGPGLEARFTTAQGTLNLR